jgi:rfaE bifunctional protein nucleotidyltransferase chain/domain
MNRGPLVVVGDLLLDEDIEGEATRLAPDAPAPVVDIARVRRRPGGAGLAALLAARHGGEVVLVAAAGPGDHEDGARARRALGDRVRLAGLPLDGTVPVKTRVLAGGRPLVRLDRGGGTPGSPDAGVLDALRSARAVLVSDYGRGTADVLRTALGALAHKVPVVWDPHPRGGPPVPGTRLATPNAGEAALYSRLPGTSLRAHADRGADLAARWEATHVAVTLGARGALLTRADAAAPLFVPAVRATTGDPCGAGDCFAATAAAALADGALPEEAVERAVAAAAASGAPADGTARAPDPAPDGDATALVRRVRARGGTVVATGGCFDLLHAGHVRLLESAGRIGDCLIVCVNSDASVARLKGPGRPLTPLADRMRVLAALASVDAVLAFDEDTPERLLATLRPDVWVKGGDYTPDELPEAELLRSWGGQTVVLPYLDGRSTTSLAHRAARSAHTPAPAPPPATR